MAQQQQGSVVNEGRVVNEEISQWGVTLLEEIFMERERKESNQIKESN
jgi:hypothetical protein